MDPQMNLKGGSRRLRNFMDLCTNLKEVPKLHGPREVQYTGSSTIIIIIRFRFSFRVNCVPFVSHTSSILHFWGRQGGHGLAFDSHPPGARVTSKLNDLTVHTPPSWGGRAKSKPQPPSGQKLPKPRSISVATV